MWCVGVATGSIQVVFPLPQKVPHDVGDLRARQGRADASHGRAPVDQGLLGQGPTADRCGSVAVRLRFGRGLNWSVSVLKVLICILVN